MRKLAASHKFGIPNSITIFLRFTKRPRLIALSSFLFAAVRTKTVSITFVFLAILPVTFDVVLRNGSAGRLFGLPHKRVFRWPRPMAIIIGSCHTEVLTFIVKPLLVAWSRVAVDWVVLATIPDSTGTIRAVVVPEFTTLGAFHISALAWGEAWSSFSPCEHATTFIFIASRFFIFIILGRKGPLYSTDRGAGWVTGLCACISERVIAGIQAVGADGHCHIHVKLITKSIEVAVCQWKRDHVALLC